MFHVILLGDFKHPRPKGPSQGRTNRPILGRSRALKSNELIPKIMFWKSLSSGVQGPHQAVGEKMHWDFSPVRSCVTDGLEIEPLILNNAILGINSLDFRQGDL